MRLDVASILVIVALAAVACPALADGPEPAAAEAQALRGPQVSQQAAKPTIVERGFDGRVIPLDGDPVEIALSRVDLDGATRDRCQRVIDQRHAILDRIVEDNLTTIVALANARRAGDDAEARRLFREVYGKAHELTGRGRLIDELRPLLPDDKHAQLTDLVGEYQDALADDRARNPSADDARLAGLSPRAREVVGHFGQEIRASYERVFGQRREAFKRLLSELGLSPEQEAKVQRIVLDNLQSTQGKPSAAQTARTFFAVYRELDTDQRAILLEKVRASRASLNPSKAPVPLTPAGPGTTPAADPGASAPAPPGRS